MEHHLPGNLNMSFIYVEGESLLMGINDIAVSLRLGLHLGHAGAQLSCSRLSAWATMSRTRSIRFGLGRFNTKAEVDYVADKLIDVVQQAPRALAAVRDGQGRHRPHQDRVGRSLNRVGKRQEIQE